MNSKDLKPEQKQRVSQYMPAQSPIFLLDPAMDSSHLGITFLNDPEYTSRG